MGCLATSQTGAKAYYFVVFALTVIVTWILRDYAADALEKVPELKTCFSTAPDGQAGACSGRGAVLRVSFGNFLFFAGHFVLLFGCRRKTDIRKYLHTGCLTLQTLGWAALIGCAFVMPNHVFVVWGQIARALGGLFLIIQIVIILDFFFVVNDWLIDREACHFTLVAGSTILYMGGLAFFCLAYYYYTPRASCRLNIFFITLTLVMGIFYSILSVTPIRAKNAGLLTSAVVFAYTVFLLWSALSSEPNDYACIAHTFNGQGDTLKVAGFAIAIASVILATFFASTEAGTFNLNGEKDDHSLDYAPDFFHCVYMLASGYVAMLFLGWNLDNTPGDFSVDKGWISVWVHMGTQWACVLLYIWLLIAPRVLRGREFGSVV